MKPALARIALAFTIVAFLAGCGSGLDHAQRLTLAALATHTLVPASSPGSSANCTACGDTSRGCRKRSTACR